MKKWECAVQPRLSRRVDPHSIFSKKHSQKHFLSSFNFVVKKLASLIRKLLAPLIESRDYLRNIYVPRVS